MKTRFILFLALLSPLFGQPVNVQKTPGTNTITGDLVFGNGMDLSATGTGTITASTLVSGAPIAGSLVFADGVRQTFNPNGTTPGINVGSNAGDPSGPSNGDLWYDSSGGLLRARIAGSTVSLGAGGSSSPLTTKGDVYTFSTVDARLGVGTNGQVLTADSVETTGLKWTTIAGSGTVTNTGSLTTDQVVVGNGTADVKILAAGTNTHVLTLTAGVPVWAAPSGGGTPGGSTTQVQYNNAGAFGGISGATTNGTATTYTANNLIATSPRFVTGINDTNGNEFFILTPTASAVNELTYANAAAGNNPTFTATGASTDIGITLVPKGIGFVRTNISTGLAMVMRASLSTGYASYRIYNDQDSGTRALEAGYSGSAWVGGILTGAIAGESGYLSTSGAFPLHLGTNTTARLILTASGKILMGTATDDTVNLLQVNGPIKSFSTTASTTTATGSGIFAGGVGVAGAVNTGGNIVTQTIGTTLGVKSGSNAKAGTFTLASGAATLSNTSITANSVLVCWLKTASGAITLAPYATAVTVGTSYTIAGGAGDNSTYNFIILEVN